jgi:Holliday junction resolvasome RuvABC DNA-binding subunit
MKLGEVLVEQKVITEEQLQEVLKYQQEHPGTMLGQALLALGFASDEAIANALRKIQQGD